MEESMKYSIKSLYIDEFKAFHKFKLEVNEKMVQEKQLF